MRRSGFTLIEFLITSIITAFILMVAVGSQRAISHANDKINEFTDATAEMRYVSGTLKKDFANIYRSDKKENTKFGGTINESDMGISSRVRFYGLRKNNVRAGKPESEIYEIEYFLEQQDGRSDLMRRVQPNPFKQEEPGGVLSVIAENIILFNVKYFENDAEDWQEEWNEKKQTLPKLVEIEIAARTEKSDKIISETILVDFPRLAQKSNNSKPEQNNNKR